MGYGPLVTSLEDPVSRHEFELMLLSPGEHYLLSQLRKEIHSIMSALTDQVDAALAQLANDTSALGGVIQAQQAANAVLQNALAASQANEVADEAELQKALDALNAANDALSSMQNSAPSDGSTDPGAGTPVSDPAPVDPGTAGDGTGSGDGGQVVVDPAPGDGTAVPADPTAGDVAPTDPTDPNAGGTDVQPTDPNAPQNPDAPTVS